MVLSQEVKQINIFELPLPPVKVILDAAKVWVQNLELQGWGRFWTFKRLVPFFFKNSKISQTPICVIPKIPQKSHKIPTKTSLNPVGQCLKELIKNGIPSNNLLISLSKTTLKMPQKIVLTAKRRLSTGAHRLVENTAADGTTTNAGRIERIHGGAHEMTGKSERRGIRW